MSTAPNKASAGLVPDPRKSATATTSQDLLEFGKIYNGKVCATASTGTYTVAVSSPKCQVPGVILGSAMLSGILGFQDSRVLEVGTRVAIAYGNPAFIFATFPSGSPDASNGGSRSAVWGDPVTPMGDAGRFGDGDAATEDMVAGEFDFDNLFGVGLRFLTSLVAMRAGDRAKVECHLLNDMVRIVSQQFRHIHGLGEELIFDHGRPSLERGYTSYRHELMGAIEESLKDGGALLELAGDEVDKVSLRRVNAVARHRYLEYLGFMGDFIHKFVCDPPAALVNMTDAASGRRAGKFWEHVGADGSYTVQSTSEVRIERVTRIPVPHRIKSHEDPEVTKTRRYRDLQKGFLKAWDYGSHQDRDAYRTTYQLRQYARWLTRFQAFARTLQLSAEFDLPTEDASPTPDWNNAEDDRQAVNPDLEYFEAYSCWCMLRDGSQIIHDGYGSSAVFSNGNVQISAARHLDLEAAGDIRMVCSSFFLKARRHIEMSASAGGIILHCYAFMRALCEKGSVHIRSDAPLASAPPPAPKVGVEPPIQPEILDSAILLESSAGRFAVRSEKQLSLTVEGAPGDDSRADDVADIVMSTRGCLRVRANKHIILGALMDLITSSRHWAAKANKWYGDIGLIQWDKFYLSPKAGLMQTNRADFKSINSEYSIRGPSRPPVIPRGSRVGVGMHTNHVDLLRIPIEWQVDEDEEATESLDFTPTARSEPTAPWEKGAEDAAWGFLAPADYYWDDREETKGALVQTLTQQYIVNDDPFLWGSDGHYTTWSWSGDRLLLSKRAGENKLGFGGAALQYAATGGKDLHKPGTQSYADVGAESSKRTWSTSSVTFRLLKHI